MVLRKEEIVGIVVLASIILGLVAPIVAYSMAKSAEIPETMFQFPFIGKLKYETSETFNVSEEFEIVLDVSSGGVEILESEKENEIKVEIYEFPMFFMLFTGPKTKKYKCYRLSFHNNTFYVDIANHLVKIYIPTKLIKKISGAISSGGFRVDINAANIEVCNIKVTGGGVELNLRELGNSIIGINVYGGGFSGELSYGNYVGEAKIDIHVSGGGGKIDIENMDAKVKVNAAISGGGGTVEINGVEVLSLGGTSETKTYVDEGFDKAAKKLLLSIDVSGGGFQIGIRK